LGYAKALNEDQPRGERWFAEKKLPAEATIRLVREVILRADRRMTEFVKYGTLTFGYDGDFATFVQVSDKKRASLMFNRGGRVPGKFPHLEGSGPSARFMRFAETAEAQARAAELSNCRRLVLAHSRRAGFAKKP
jgi:hypothetical protein